MQKIFKNKKVVIMGLGLHGGGVDVARFFSEQKAKVLVTDLKTEDQLKESVGKLKGLPIEFVLGGHRKEDFSAADLIIKNPDVSDSSPYLEIARKNNVKIETDVSIFFKLSKAFVIGVTGSKGKTTTAWLIYHVLKKRYPELLIAGNIGVSPLKYLSQIKKNGKIILELSSFELEGLRQSPQIAIFTNILKDHLNRYASMSDYINAKKAMFKYQKEQDFLILNYDDEIVRGFEKEAKSKVYFYSAKQKPQPTGCYLREDKVFFKQRKKMTLDIKDFKLFGNHNVSNMLAAITVCKVMKMPCKDISSQIKTFKGVPYRQEFIKEINGVKYFNDTAATMPDAAVEAIKTFRARFKSNKIILIAGGQNKNLDFKEMANAIKEKIDFLILLPGTATDILKSELGKNFKAVEVGSMASAVLKAKVLAKKDDIVLLSPGAASFNLFKNEFDRGDKFNEELKK